MNAMLTQDETCAEADTIPAPSALLIENLSCGFTDAEREPADETSGKPKRTTRRLTIPEQDKLRERIAHLESRLRYTAVALIAAWLVGAVMGGAWL